MLLRNWFENLKTNCGLNSLRTLRRRSPLRKRDFSPSFQAAEVFEERRMLSAGALDPTFGTGGTATPTTPIIGTAGAVAVYSNAQAATAGDVVAAGNVAITTSRTINHNFAVVRYTSNGAPDSSFGSGGEVTTDIGSLDDYAESVAIQPDGKLVVTTGLDFLDDPKQIKDEESARIITVPAGKYLVTLYSYLSGINGLLDLHPTANAKQVLAWFRKTRPTRPASRSSRAPRRCRASRP